MANPLVGPSGPAGTPGTPGGPQGLQGPTGAQGLNGLTGGQGSTGPQGLVGNTGAGGALGYFISAYDTTIQTNQGATFANQFSYDTTAEFNGISIQNGTQVLFDYPGTYNLQFSAQVEKTDAGSDEIEIWLSKNGTNVDWSNTTTIATTAFVQAAIALLYPVGSIYTNATNSTNPGTLLGLTT